MKVNSRFSCLVVLLMASLAGPSANAQLPETAITAIDISRNYRVVSNVTYFTANSWEAKLDLYLPRESEEPTPTLVYYHGGGWVIGSKEQVTTTLFPYLEMGFAVVNVAYRLAKTSPAPAAVVDCLCALRWVKAHAEEYNLDTDRIITSGHSAGGHLALIVGMMPFEVGYAQECPAMEELMANELDESVRVAGVINWYGITDVADLAEGENTRLYAQQWLGSQPDRMAIARKVSPLSYVRTKLPPILTIHGDADTVVPYQHAVDLHEALDGAKAPNRLLTVSGGDHGGFDRADQLKAYEAIRAFLTEHGIWKPPPAKLNTIN